MKTKTGVIDGFCFQEKSEQSKYKLTAFHIHE